jgi:DNA-binding MarR family transcriptional regulator
MESDSRDLRLLFADLVLLEIELWDALEARLRAEGAVGLGTFQTLEVIARVDGCRIHDIVSALSITVGGASKTVDRMESAGLCARRPHPTDRRSSIIALTPMGKRARAAAEKIVAAELEARIGGALSDRGFDQLSRGIATLRAALGAR